MSGHDPRDDQCLSGRTSTSAILDISFSNSKLLYQWLLSKLSDPRHLVADPQELSCVQPTWTARWEYRQTYEKVDLSHSVPDRFRSAAFQIWGAA